MSVLVDMPTPERPYVDPANAPAVSSLRGEKYILVDISEQHMYVYESGVLIYSFVVSTGIGNSTRTGVFHVLDKIPNAYGANWNIWMPNWLGIYWSGSLENGIHALIHLVGGWTGGRTIQDSSVDELTSMLNQHAWTTFNLFKSYVPHLIAAGWGVSSPSPSR